MGFKLVYDTLVEVFPQIDARALRAVAIEHSKDADVAVQAVLEEIIPFFIERSRPSSPLSGSISEDKYPEALLGAIASMRTSDGPAVNTVDSAELQNGNPVTSENQQSFHDFDGGYSEPFNDTYDGHHEEEGNIAASAFSEETPENRIVPSADDTLQVEVSGNPETEKTISADKCTESSINVVSDNIPCHTLETEHDVDMDINEKTNLVHQSENLDAHLETEVSTAANEEKDLEKSCSDGNNSVDGTAFVTVHDLTMSSLGSSVQLVEVPGTHESNLEKLDVCLSDDTASKMETVNDSVGSENRSALSGSTSQSSQILIIDVLEETISDARNNKKTLFSAMESVISLMKEVELKEKSIEQVKEDAVTGGNNILDKVDDLKRMLKHAKDANDMHAGEVYGEKAILGTELRELQSRVVSLSDERDKSLSVLHEMRETLEVRLAAAENEIRFAELEKLEKEKAARKLLTEQELIMEKVVEQSNILRQQAEDNAKLSEFLLDRGRVVDMLQGEIAVICQDVRLLKEQFDENVPFSKSLSSSQTSCILASSSSSLKSMIPDQVDPLPEAADSFETEKKRREEEAAIDDKEALAAEEGWEFFDSREIEA